MDNRAPKGFIHCFVPGESPSAPLLVLLHGTGGDENDLLDAGRLICPDAALLGVRGRVLENGMPRFFRRLAEGVFDKEDLIRRTHELCDFLATAVETYECARRKVVAVGYSNGANIAASALLLRPDTFDGALLLRAMVPLVPEVMPDLAGLPVIISSGKTDSLIPPEKANRLAAMLGGAGADVDHRWYPGGHQLGRTEFEDGRAWLEQKFTGND